MKRHLPGLHSEGLRGDEVPQGIFLVRVDRAYYRWHPQKPFFVLSFAVLEPQDLASRKISGRLYATMKALWRLNWFLRDFGYDHPSFQAGAHLKRGISNMPRTPGNFYATKKK